MRIFVGQRNFTDDTDESYNELSGTWEKCRIVDVESRDAVYRSTTVTDIGPCAPKTRACSISAVSTVRT